MYVVFIFLPCIYYLLITTSFLLVECTKLDESVIHYHIFHELTDWQFYDNFVCKWIKDSLKITFLKVQTSNIFIPEKNYCTNQFLENWLFVTFLLHPYFNYYKEIKNHSLNPWNAWQRWHKWDDSPLKILPTSFFSWPLHSHHLISMHSTSSNIDFYYNLCKDEIIISKFRKCSLEKNF
jgi:hypothetical protein